MGPEDAGRQSPKLSVCISRCLACLSLHSDPTSMPLNVFYFSMSSASCHVICQLFSAGSKQAFASFSAAQSELWFGDVTASDLEWERADRTWTTTKKQQLIIFWIFVPEQANWTSCESFRKHSPSNPVTISDSFRNVLSDMVILTWCLVDEGLGSL